MSSPPGGALVRAAALVHAASGIGIVASMVIIIAVALRDRRLPVSHGIHWLDGGPFGRLGFRPVLRLAGAFVIVGLLEVLVGARLWRRGTGADREALAVDLLGVPFWVGFNLPYAPPVVALRLGRAASPSDSLTPARSVTAPIRGSTGRTLEVESWAGTGAGVEDLSTADGPATVRRRDAGSAQRDGG